MTLNPQPSTLNSAWHWPLLAPLLRKAFAPIPNIPLPAWAKKHVFLSRKITAKPGFCDPDEFLWTWEFQEILRTRQMWTAPHPADGAICLVDPHTPGAKVSPVSRVTAKKSSVTGYTEGFLNYIRYLSKHDPQNVIFAIDSAKEAANINENRLQPTLRQLGEEIFTGADDDVKRFLLCLKRMLVYFLGSYSEAAFANKFAEVAVGDELEEHGDPNTVENLESRIKSASRPLLVLLSKPKLAGGPIDLEHKKGTQCVYEIPCPHCTAANGGVPSGFQQLLQDEMKFDHCKDMLGEWDFSRMSETFFRCIHCKKPIEENWKRWFNSRKRRRWRLTNPNPEPEHVSFHVSDFYGYHPDAAWRKLAVKYIQSKGDPVARQSYRNHHEGLEWEQRATKTEIEDILILRRAYRFGAIPFKPAYVLLGGDVGLTYARGAVLAFKRDGEAVVIDRFNVSHPDDVRKFILAKRYKCAETGKEHMIQLGFLDGKYRKEEVTKASLLSAGRLYRVVGNPGHIMGSAIAFSQPAGFPNWFGIVSFNDRDAKSELYEFRISEWAEWERRLKNLPADHKDRIEPSYPRLGFPEDLKKDDEFCIQLTKERLVELTSKDKGWLPHAARQFEWRRIGPNHDGDGVKVAIVGFRWLTRRFQVDVKKEGASETGEPVLTEP